jgi:hypothetical protein
MIKANKWVREFLQINKTPEETAELAVFLQSEQLFIRLDLSTYTTTYPHPRTGVQFLLRRCGRSANLGNSK